MIQQRPSRKWFQFRLASLLLVMMVSAIAFAVWFSQENLEQSLRRDLKIATTAQLHILEDGTRSSRFETEERYAWVLVESEKKFVLMYATRTLDESTPWATPIIMISWIGDQVGAEPFYREFDNRPTQAEIDDFIRYSDGWL